MVVRGLIERIASAIVSRLRTGNGNMSNQQRWTFSVQINGSGPVRPLKVRTGVYAHAAMSALAAFELNTPVVIKIWVDELLPDYGPYYFMIEEDAYGRVVVSHVVPVVAQGTTMH